MRRAASAAVLALTVTGCAYYNAMWSAERFARDARRLEERGRESEARTQWARAAVKAESVLVHHPHSRWADDALVLQGEGIAFSGRCAAAAAPIARALATVTNPPLRERAGLAAAHCALTTGTSSAAAERALAEPLVSTDARRRSRAEYLAGENDARRGAYDSAAAHLRRSQEPEALPARARVLLAAGRPADAAALLDTVAAVRFREAEWIELLDGLAVAGAADAASKSLDRMLARARVPSGARARLLIADGDRRFAEADLDDAAARYRQAAVAVTAGGGGGGGGGGAVPGAIGETGDEGSIARVREQRVLAARAAAPGDLSPVVTELTRIAGAGGGASDAQILLSLVARVSATATSPGAAFRSAELARDSLAAPRLAGRLFLDLATADSGSLFAPKALVAALALLPEQRDSIVNVLDRSYAASPYTRALRGEASPAYAALEDSLAHELGVELARVAPAGAARVRGSGLLTGPRGPWLDDAPSRGGTPPPSVRGRPQPGEPGRRPAERPTRERPVVPPASS